MYIERALEVSGELFEALNRLIPQLGAYKAAPTWEELATIIGSESSTLWIARYPEKTGNIVGVLSLAIYRVPTGLRSVVEDVVVDQNMRRRGIAEALLNSAIDFARSAGANGVALTSNPQREAANLLYQSMGFKRRETNSYIFRLK